MNVRVTRLSVVAMAALLPLVAAAQERITPKSELDHAHGAYVIAEKDGDTFCREASGDEAKRLNAPLGVPTRVFGERDRSRVRANHGDEQHGLNIILRGTAQLDEQPVAKAAFERAAAIWESRIANPITIYVDVDYGPKRFGEAFPEGVIASATSAAYLWDAGDYALLPPLFADRIDNDVERSIYNRLPLESVPTDAGNINRFGAASAIARTLGLDDFTPAADPTDPAPSIGFNSAFNYDFEPNDGIAVGRKDFVGVVVHEIGHMLGFSSRVGAGELSTPSQPITVAPSIMDLFRFRPGVTLDGFGTSNRILSTGGDQIFFAGGEAVAFSTGNPRGENGDGQQASHWKDDAQTGRMIGIMDPTLSNGRRVELTRYDLEGFGMLGYDIVAKDCAELEPNDGAADANGIPLGTPCSGVAGRNESSSLTVSYEGGSLGYLHDFYKVTLPQAAKLNVTLSFSNAAADLELFLVDVDGTNVAIRYASTGETTTENFETDKLPAGTYLLAVSAFNGTSAYTVKADAIGLLPPPPAAPSALTATTLSKSAIRLNWTDNANNETEFRIEQKNAGGTFVDIGSVPANTTTMDVTGLTASTTATFRVRARNEGGDSTYSTEASAKTNAEPFVCAPNDTTVCLLNGRFQVSVAYLNQFANPPQPGSFRAGRLLEGVQNPDTALFGFSSAQAVEVVVRIQDARPFAPRFDIYYGGLTDVEYTVTVTDTQAGVTRTYRNAPGKVGGGVDRTSFPASSTLQDTNYTQNDDFSNGVEIKASDVATTATPCVANGTTVCLLNNRFLVTIAYLNQFAVPPAPGSFAGARLLDGVQNPDVGLFGFSNPKAVEVLVRIQDARPFAPRFDIYYGGMTDVEYTVSVTDTVTGVTKTYRNAPGTVGGGVDRVTFPAN